jgi:hypothetical protein
LVFVGQAARAEGVSLGLGAGVVKIEDVDQSKLWVTGNVRLGLGDRFALEPEVGWYGEDEEFFGTTISVDVINFGGSALILFPLERVDLFLGGGAGGHMFRLSGGGESTSETELGLHALGGLDLPVSDSIKLFGAARYEIIQHEDENTKQWKFYGGIRIGG